MGHGRTVEVDVYQTTSIKKLMKDDQRFATVNCASYGHDARAVGDEASMRIAMDAVTTLS